MAERGRPKKVVVPTAEKKEQTKPVVPTAEKKEQTKPVVPTAEKKEQTKEDIILSKMKAGNVSLYIPEILDMVATSLKDERVSILKNNMTPALKEILRLTYADGIEMMFTTDDLASLKYPKIDIPTIETAPANLFREYKRLNIFTSERGSNIRKTKLIDLLEQICSVVHESEINIILYVLSRTEMRGITKDMIKEIFPEFFNNSEEKNETEDKFCE